MTALANAFKRAAGVPEDKIINTIPTTFYERKIVAETVVAKTKEVKEPEIEYVEITNRHGYKDFGILDNGKFYPVCATCLSMKLENRGEGTACGTCNHDVLMEMQADYDQGQLPW